MSGKRIAERGKVQPGRRKPKEFHPVTGDDFKPASLEEVRSRAAAERGTGQPEGADGR